VTVLVFFVFIDTLLSLPLEFAMISECDNMRQALSLQQLVCVASNAHVCPYFTLSALDGSGAYRTQKTSRPFSSIPLALLYSVKQVRGTRAP